MRHLGILVFVVFSAALFVLLVAGTLLVRAVRGPVVDLDRFESRPCAVDGVTNGVDLYA